MKTSEIRKKYIPFLERTLTPQRLQHSLGVMTIMGELADIYQLDRAQAMTAGLLHDAAKDLTPEFLLDLADEARIRRRHPSERNPVYLHAPVGAYLVTKHLAIHDPLVLDAIATHSHVEREDTANQSFSWCLRAADVLAPIRSWHGMKKLRSTVYAGHLEEAKLLICGWLIEFFLEQSIPIHPDLLKNFQVFSSKLPVHTEFFERW